MRFIVWREKKVSTSGSSELKAMAETLYCPKSVFICTLKQTENTVPETLSMLFSFVESEETRMMGLPDCQKVLK